MQQYTVLQSQRLDVFLAEQECIKSREVAKGHIKKGHVAVKGEVILKPAYQLKEGDTVEVKMDNAELSIAENGGIQPVDLHLDVLYEDDACLVIAKPREVSVHPASTIPKEEDTILHGAAWLCAKRSLPFSVSETLVHRLDKETTGCLLLAKNPGAHMQLQKQFESRTVRKHYLVFVYGVPKPAKAMIDSPIGRHATERTKMSVLQTGKGREAQTTYEVLSSDHGAALLLCDLHTGRTHQVRVHLATIGHPVLGDPAYGTRPSGKLSKELHIDFLCLHAWKLSFVSPATDQEVTVACPLPKDFSSALSAIGLTV